MRVGSSDTATRVPTAASHERQARLGCTSARATPLTSHRVAPQAMGTTNQRVAKERRANAESAAHLNRLSRAKRAESRTRRAASRGESRETKLG